MQLVSEKCNLTVQDKTFTDEKGKVSNWKELVISDNTGIYHLGDGGWDLSAVPTLEPVSFHAEVEQSDFGKKGWKLAKKAPPVIVRIMK